MRSILVAAVFAIVLSGHLPGQSTSAQETVGVNDADDWLEVYREKATERWEKEIVKLEARNGQQQHSADSILFIGSSSIRRWATIETDVAPYRPIQRGYGGAKFTDLAIYARRLIEPHQYRALVIFVANDVSGREDDHSADQVEQLVRYVVGVSHAHRGDAPVLLIEITPTAKRFEVWPKIREVNARLREIAFSTPNTYFIPTASHYLDPDGSPRTELFVDDKLHLNDEGYRIWGRLVRGRLDDVLRLHTLFEAREAEAASATASSESVPEVRNTEGN